jgi:[lysine-biosynthesis-protein LysW]--L-2-aminoadipate ligase
VATAGVPVPDEPRLAWRLPRNVWVAAGEPTATNARLVDALRERGLPAWRVQPATLDRHVRTGDLVVGRLDVRRTLDGIEDGLPELRSVEDRGIHVLNRSASLLACHDKLQTALRLGRFDVPHPVTAHLDQGASVPRCDLPVVVKPRFGSWGRDVVRCESLRELQDALNRFRGRNWFRRHGALVQELVPPLCFDLRILVAGGRVVGAVERVAAVGEWRTNIALGGFRRRVDPPPEACRLALAAATAVGADLVGVDLLPLPEGGHVVLELNGAVDVTSDYSLSETDVFAAVADAVDAAVSGQDLDTAGAGYS